MGDKIRLCEFCWNVAKKAHKTKGGKWICRTCAKNDKDKEI